MTKEDEEYLERIARFESKVLEEGSESQNKFRALIKSLLEQDPSSKKNPSN
jgi:hypothetical protein